MFYSAFIIVQRSEFLVFEVGFSQLFLFLDRSQAAGGNCVLALGDSR